MKNKLPLVSILICTHNAQDTIGATLESCLDQTYKDFEILIHDDQSTDRTIEIIERINSAKIKIIRSWKKLWPYKWLNFLLDNASGEYIAIQDHDDLRLPQKLEKQIDFLESDRGKKFIGCGTNTRMWYEWDDKYFDYYLGKENYYTIHPSLVFRNNNKYRYFNDIVYMWDALFMKKVLCKWKKCIYNISELLTIHRVISGEKNYSYKWFTFTKDNLHTLYALHPWWYATAALGWETMRKIVYPVLQKIWKGSWIDKMERLPFKMIWRD